MKDTDNNPFVMKFGGINIREYIIGMCMPISPFKVNIELFADDSKVLSGQAIICDGDRYLKIEDYFLHDHRQIRECPKLTFKMIGTHKNNVYIMTGQFKSNLCMDLCMEFNYNDVITIEPLIDINHVLNIEMQTK